MVQTQEEKKEYGRKWLQKLIDYVKQSKGDS